MKRWLLRMAAKILARAQTADQTLSTQKDATPATPADTQDAVNAVWMLSEGQDRGVALVVLPTDSSMAQLQKYLDAGFHFVAKPEYDEAQQKNVFPN